MEGPRLERALTSVPPLPPAAMEGAAAVLDSARLFRYGEHVPEGTWVARLERAFAEHFGTRFAVAVNSGGSAMFLALRSAGVESDDVVLLNAFTLAPVPGAIEHLGAKVVLVDVDGDLRVDLEDLEQAILEHQPKAFLLSHMRGHVADMAGVVALCKAHGVILIEDCAHTLGASY
ncbi:MAG: aminotransferase class I/II-fold pyridoxal phosphate-dependent enzyme, partial [Candidatus Thermoplasmatota archaeon]|nr:aminotransferase class I/II-fold pyridoxal phosphate-dependent enzyme [Candidatus Thermoplasmatota archaeon]